MKSSIKMLAGRSFDRYLREVVENDFQLRSQGIMIVCLCKGVSSRTILDEVRRGNCTLQGIAQACQAGRSCGSCVSQIKEIIHAAGAHAHAHDESLPPSR